jgi:hypothetical protein
MIPPRARRPLTEGYSSSEVCRRHRPPVRVGTCVTFGPEFANSPGARILKGTIIPPTGYAKFRHVKYPAACMAATNILMKFTTE